VQVKSEKLPNSMAKITVTIPKEEFIKAIDVAYNKNKNRFKVDGFRKGKVNREIIEKMYGEGVFYEDAANECINNSYDEAIKESGLDVVSRPEVDIPGIESGSVSRDKDFVYTATFAIRPDVKIKNYKGYKIKKVDTDVKPEMVDAELKAMQDKNARISEVTDENATVQDGNVAVIDFEGFKDDKLFEGGSAENYELTIGSHTFIDNFEDQLIGMKVGDEKDVHVTFPKDYGVPDLAGAPVVFKVKVNKIKAKEVDPLDDEFASEVSEFSTLAELKKSIEDRLKERLELNAKNVYRDAVLAELEKNVELNIPDPMIETSIDRIIDRDRRNMAQRGLKYEDYLKVMNMTVKDHRDRMRDRAISEIKISLGVEEVGKLENIKVSDDVLKEKITQLYKGYGIPDPTEYVNKISDAEKESMREEFMPECVMDYLVENADIK
jgi:trigger factor